MPPRLAVIVDLIREQVLPQLAGPTPPDPRVADPAWWSEVAGLDIADVEEVLRTVPSSVLWRGAPWALSVPMLPANPVEGIRALLFYRMISYKLTVEAKWSAADMNNIQEFLHMATPLPEGDNLETIDEAFKKIPHGIIMDQAAKSLERERVRRDPNTREPE